MSKKKMVTIISPDGLGEAQVLPSTVAAWKRHGWWVPGGDDEPSAAELVRDDSDETLISDGHQTEE